MGEELAGEIARGLQRRGLGAPARLLLEAHRPLRPLLAEAAAFISPLARPLLGSRFAALAGLLDREAGYDELIDALDRADAEHR
ncbi:MAG TPA: hypothetical protein VKU35_06520 [Candidatus Limnocylindria bacterium]|nr:hypothetical protein [Candidatus Limnocylindria bacterium]